MTKNKLETVFEALGEVNDKVSRIENIVSASAKDLTSLLAFRDRIDLFFSRGIEGVRKQAIEETQAPGKMFYSSLANRINQDPVLGLPHWKILQYLSRQFDTSKCQPTEVHFSKIVRECRLGKNKAGEYLKTLADKGFINRRSDGYRVWYSMRKEGES